MHTGTGVAGVYAPAFVERLEGHEVTETGLKRVAGVYAPAFVERDVVIINYDVLPQRVAGVYAPAFVERSRHSVLDTLRR